MDTVRQTSRRQGRRPALPRRRAARAPWVGPALALLGLLLLCAVTLVGLRVARADTSLPGTTVAGVDVGGLQPDGIGTALTELASSRGARPIEATRGSESVQSSAAELGYQLDVEATTAAVMRRGRQANPLLAFRDQVRAWFDPAVVVPVESFDSMAFEAWVGRIADDLSLPPVRGDLVITGQAVQVVEPEPGLAIDAPALRQATLDALSTPGPIRIEVPTTMAAPVTSPEQLQALAAQAERAISAPVTLTRGDVALTFTAAQIATLLEVTAATDEVPGDAPLALAIHPDGLLAMLPAEQFSSLTTEPADAAFEVEGGQVRLVESVEGFTFDAPSAAAQLLEVATGTGPRQATLEGATVPPAFTTADAQGLGIVEEVASFTTQHPCCQSRVTNIQRMADLVRGTIVEPGETFSLNGLVGERTTEKGFVGGGAISGGEFVEQIGGGVSQFTTTMFNTIFFGGYDIVEFKPHSYYISRYPEGREATLNYSPSVDLKFTNDSPHGIYIDTSYTDTSITVTFFSTEYAEVDTTTGARYGFREPTEQREPSDELAEGEERVSQSGRQGFSIDFTRTLTYVDGRTATEQFTTVYLPEPRIVLFGTGDGEPEPAGTPDAATEGETDAGTDAETEGGTDGGTDGEASDEGPDSAPPPPEPTAAPQPAGAPTSAEAE